VWALENPAQRIPFRFDSLPFSLSPLIGAGLLRLPSPRYLFTLTALCAAWVGSFFADCLSVSDECSVEFASPELSPEKRSFKPHLPFASLSNVCVESRIAQTLSFFVVNAGCEAIFGAELLGVKLHNALYDETTVAQQASKIL